MQIKVSVRWNSVPSAWSFFFLKEKLAIPDPDVDKDVEKVEILYLDLAGGS